MSQYFLDTQYIHICQSDKKTTSLYTKCVFGVHWRLVYTVCQRVVAVAMLTASFDLILVPPPSLTNPGFYKLDELGLTIMKNIDQR